MRIGFSSLCLLAVALSPSCKSTQNQSAVNAIIGQDDRFNLENADIPVEAKAKIEASVGILYIGENNCSGFISSGTLYSSMHCIPLKSDENVRTLFEEYRP